ncbi:MAG: hypothetical protein H6739_40670 [Alphaproteobacteria bacterium]|nr:hypothetical protein [Alphaproteobacteria bacterium]
MRTFLTSLTLGLLVACPGAGDNPDDSTPACDTWIQDTGLQIGVIDPVCRCGDAGLEIGTGDLRYEVMEDGAVVHQTHGPQGGWHLLTAARLEHTRDVVEILTWMTDAETGKRGTDDLIYRVRLVPGEQCEGTYPNMYLYLDASELAEGEADTPPEVMACRYFDIHMCMTDSGGRDLCTEKRVFLKPDPSDVESGLAEPCDGPP